MSLVVAIKDGNRIVLGADKQSSTAYNKDHICTKIWEVQDMEGALMGGVGSVRASQIIQYSDIIDKNAIKGEINTSFIVQCLAPTLAATLKANGVVIDAKEDDQCIMMPSSFIFAYKDKAWMIWNDLSVSEINDYFAIGSGSDIAKGVLYATAQLDPFTRITTCIAAAAESNLFVDDGVDLIATEEYEDDLPIIADIFGLNIVEEDDKLSQTEQKEEEKTEEVRDEPAANTTTEESNNGE